MTIANRDYLAVDILTIQIIVVGYRTVHCTGDWLIYIIIYYGDLYYDLLSGCQMLSE